MRVAIGLPAFNEEKDIASLIAKLKNLSYSVIVCNDGSSDMTGIIAEKMGAMVINHPQNSGYGSAIRSLFDKARELDYDILITFDADGQHRVSDIKTVLGPLLNGEADLVIGSRFLGQHQLKIPTYRKVGIKTITKLATITSNNKITDAQSGFRGYNKKALAEINPSDTGMGVSTEILIKADSEKLKIQEVPITVFYKGDTSTHSPTSHGVSVVFSTMRFISLEHPLKFYGIPGIVFLAIGLFFTVWVLQEFSLSRKIITNIALIAGGSLILGTVFMMTCTILYSVVSLIRERRS